MQKAIDLPLFPLPQVLFPGGRLALRVVHPHHMDLIRSSLKQGQGFGMVMLSDDGETEDGKQTISSIGTYVEIIDFEQLSDGVLGFVVEGRSKFHVNELRDVEGLQLAGRCELLEAEPTVALPEEKVYLAELLESLTRHEAVQRLDLNIDYEDAVDVGCRLAELIRCSNSDKQALLELDEPLIRLEHLAGIVARIQQSSPG